ncbi:MAG: S1 RNA-binding domain-containing protein [Nanoarchaeota archaeon]
MFYKKPNLPNNNDFVLCTVKTILHHSVFVSLDEYDNLEGLVHISEIAPGRIRNIRDYVKPDKRIVCKVLKVNIHTKQIDLSLRRVSINAMKIKIDNFRQEEKAEKLLEIIGKQMNFNLERMYKEFGIKLIEEFGSLQESFNKISNEGENVLKQLGFNEKSLSIIVKFVKEKIKPPKAKAKLILELKNFEENGLELIKGLLAKVKEINKKAETVEVNYISAPNYSLEITTSDVKNADHIIENLADEIINYGKKLGIIGKWLRAS